MTVTTKLLSRLRRPQTTVRWRLTFLYGALFLGCGAALQRQPGHADLAITSVYLRGIDNTEIVNAVHERPAPMIPATHGL